MAQQYCQGTTISITSNGCIDTVVPWQSCWTKGPLLLQSGGMCLVIRVLPAEMVIYMNETKNMNPIQ